MRILYIKFCVLIFPIISGSYALACEDDPNLTELDLFIDYDALSISESVPQFTDSFCVKGRHRYMISFSYIPKNSLPVRAVNGRSWFYTIDENGNEVEMEPVTLKGKIAIRDRANDQVVLEEEFNIEIPPAVRGNNPFSFWTPFRVFKESVLQLELSLDYEASNDFLNRYGSLSF